MGGYDYESATSLERALYLLKSNKNAHILAGGTDLILKMKHKQLSPRFIVGIGKLKELQYINVDQEYAYIGAGVKINDLLKNNSLRKCSPLLLRAAKEIGSPEIRNMATIGGNICCVGANCGACGLPGCRNLSGGGVLSCRYASSADLIPPLLALDAGLVFVSSAGERKIALNDFWQGNRKIGIQTGEVLKEIYFKIPKESTGWGYHRLGSAEAMGIAIISVAVLMDKKQDNVCSNVSLAIGGSLNKPVRVSGIQHLAENKQLDENTMNAIVDATIKQIAFQENLYMSVEYRQEVIGFLIKDAMRQAMGV